MKSPEARKLEKEAFANYQAALKVCDEALKEWVLSLTIRTGVEMDELKQKENKPTNN